jgi:hypothetical protein
MDATTIIVDTHIGVERALATYDQVPELRRRLDGEQREQLGSELAGRIEQLVGR